MSAFSYSVSHRPPANYSFAFVAECFAIHEKNPSLSMAQISAAMRAPLTLPSPLSEVEACGFYKGLPSSPILVARASRIVTPWKSTGWSVMKVLRPVGDHAINAVWEYKLAPRIHNILDSMKVKWTSTDVVRIGIKGEHTAPVVLWIGVMPRSLSGDDGVFVTTRCREILDEFNLSDIDVQIRESIVTRSTASKLLRPSYGIEEVRDLLTTTLGLPICAQNMPWAEGTCGFSSPRAGNPTGSSS